MRQSIAKLFATGGSQAVRLQAEFRFDGITEVYIRRDDATGDVILSTAMRKRCPHSNLPRTILIPKCANRPGWPSCRSARRPMAPESIVDHRARAGWSFAGAMGSGTWPRTSCCGPVALVPIARCCARPVAMAMRVTTCNSRTYSRSGPIA